jgi:hypothetical protein
MARVIAQSKAKRWHYGDALISVACPAVANGAASRSGIENAVRRSLRSGWAKEDGRVLENSEQPT